MLFCANDMVNHFHWLLDDLGIARGFLLRHKRQQHHQDQQHRHLVHPWGQDFEQQLQLVLYGSGLIFTNIFKWQQFQKARPFWTFFNKAKTI